MRGARGRGSRRPGLSSLNILPEGEKRERRPRREQDFEFDDDEYDREDIGQDAIQVYEAATRQSNKKGGLSTAGKEVPKDTYRKGFPGGRPYTSKGPLNMASALLPATFSYPPPFLIIGGPPRSPLRTHGRKSLKQRMLERWDPAYRLRKLRQEQERAVEEAKKNEIEQEEYARLVEARQAASVREDKHFFGEKLKPRYSKTKKQQTADVNEGDIVSVFIEDSFKGRGISISAIPAAQSSRQTPICSSIDNGKELSDFQGRRTTDTACDSGAHHFTGNTTTNRELAPAMKSSHRFSLPQRPPLQLTSRFALRNGKHKNENGISRRSQYNVDRLTGVKKPQLRRKVAGFPMPPRPLNRRYPKLLRFDGNTPVPTPAAFLKRTNDMPTNKKMSLKSPYFDSAIVPHSLNESDSYPPSIPVPAYKNKIPSALRGDPEEASPESNDDAETKHRKTVWDYENTMTYEIRKVQSLAAKKYDVRMNLRGKTKLEDWLQWIEMIGDNVKKLAVGSACNSFALGSDLTSKDGVKRKAAILSMNNEKLRLLEALMLRLSSRDGILNWRELFATQQVLARTITER